ncbi:MAG: hypothetical protein M4579_005268 [Chaenotheca gracillima]|nr:MAG: hypothetical protein M4579_005268 [Chaenotheca gracillima]
MRLLLLSILATGALATYGSSGDTNSYNSDNSNSGNNYNSNGKGMDNSQSKDNQGMGGDQSKDNSSMDNKNSGYQSKSNDKNQNMDNSKMGSSNTNSYGNSGSTITVDVSVTLIQQNFGSENGVRMFSQPSNVGMTHKVMVGGDTLTYQPDTITAAVGDVVEFTFGKKNHTVTQSSFDKPCVKMAGGVDSGFMPNPNGDMGPPPSYSFQVKDTKPIWFYCRQKVGTHCGKGMVFSINPTAEKSQAIFKAMAMQQNGTADAGTSSATSVAVTTATTMATMASPPPPPPPAASTAAAPPPPPPPPPPAAVATTAAAPPPPPPPPASSAAVASAPPPASSGTSEVQNGTGSGSGDSCSCMCLCGVGAFGAGQGTGNFGGQGGTLPASFAAM